MTAHASNDVHQRLTGALAKWWLFIATLSLGLFTASIAAAGLASTPAIPYVATSPTGFPRVVIKGDYADPTIMRDGADYYMTHSPFGFAPAFLIWHSTDLVHWTPIARAMTGAAHAYAPELVKVGKKYYIYYPSNKTNYVITADRIEGPWSAPIDLKVPKIDPGHVIGEDGKRYLFTSSGRRVELSDDGLSTVGESKEVYAGWKYPSDWKTECMCVESPKLFRRGGYFYMVSAEGGTAGPATSHMAVVARSKSIHGPWENSPFNPLVHTYGSDEKWWSKGHGTIIDDVNGNWWIVYHAYLNGATTLGRMTLIDPVQWTSDGWPVLATKPQPLPNPQPADATAGLPLSDTFSGDKVGIQWTSWGNMDGVSVGDGWLHLKGRGESPRDAKQVMVLPTDARYEVQVELELADEGSGGMMLIYNNKALAGVSSNGANLSIYRTASDISSKSSRYGRHFYLRILNQDEHATFMISRNGVMWDTLASDVDVSMMNHNNYHGFLGLKVALFSSGGGEVNFDNFQYRSLP